MDNEVIEKLLQTTGLSCDDLLSKLQQYKIIQGSNKNNENSKSENITKNSPEKEKQEELVENDICTLENTVILETKSSLINNSSLIHVETKKNEEIIEDNKEYPSNGHCEQEEGKSIISENVTSKSLDAEVEDKKLTSCDNKLCNDQRDIKCEEENSSTKSSQAIIAPIDVAIVPSNVQSDDKLSKNEEKAKCEQNNYTKCSEIIVEFNGEDAAPSSAKKSSTDEEEAPSSSNEDKPQENLNDILRQQLSSLRNMKKHNNYFSDINTKTKIASQTLKKKRKSIDLNTLSKLSVSDDETVITESNTQPVIGSDEALISLTDETQFVIMNVSGGVDLVSDKLSEKNEKEDENRKFASISNEKPSHLPKPPETITASPEKKTFLTVRKDISASNSFEKDPGISNSPKKSEKSPFVSDSLDDFLNDSSELKISYALPKLGAEEGLMESQKLDKFDNLYNNKVLTSNSAESSAPKEKKKVIKAKTLAEMRRQVEKLKKSKQKSKKTETALRTKKGEEPTAFNDLFTTQFEEENNDLLKVTKIDPFHGNLPDTKIKQPKDEKENTVKLKIEEPVKAHDEFRNAYIIYNKKRILVPSINNDECVAVIDTQKKRNKKRPQTTAPPLPPPPLKKPSLLRTLAQSKPSSVKYKPGPLSKKVHLQDSTSTDHWTSCIKKLPRIFLEITPEIRKPLEPLALHRLPVFEDAIISRERANFAVSVVQARNCTQTTPQSFTFQVPYKNNQVNMLVRKRQDRKIKINYEKSNLDPETEIKNILDNVINYVEVKEVEESLIKDAESLEDDNVPSAAVVKKPKKRHDRLKLEMNRLSCKIIDVATNRDEDSCSKPHCQLGCICKSLKCEKIYCDHCQEPKCMFECTCPPIKEKQILTSNSSLSSTSVNHLDDKVKRNLAKVERDFTQTLIQTDSDVILVGSGGNKLRRATKAPKKYNDFINETYEDSSRRSVRNYVANCEPKECSIELDKVNMNNLVPYCLCHKMYNCHCNYQSTDFPPEQRKVPKIVIVKKESSGEKQGDEWMHRKYGCARIRTVFTNYRERNSHPQYREKLEKYVKRGYASKQRKELLSSIQQEQQFEFVTLEPPQNPMVSLASKKSSSKRKQQFEVREETALTTFCSKEFALQRRKKLKKPPVCDDPDAYQQVFKDELRLSLKENQDLLKIVGEENASLEYIRLLPWTSLVLGYRNKQIRIWAKDRRTSPVLCNIAPRQPPKNFTDIKLVREKAQIVKWILRGIPPKDKPVQFFHLILLPKKEHFLIAGYCLKNVQSPQEPKVAPEKVALEEHSALEGPSASAVEVPALAPAESTTFKTPMIQTRTIKCTHKDIANNSQTLMLTNRLFQPRKLYYGRDAEKSFIPNNRDKGETGIIVNLPVVTKKFRWRMIYLNSDFSFLSFKLSKYSIKYTDLMDVVKMAQNITATITLRNKAFSENYSHPQFGIFCAPHHPDRLFIGPFLPDEEHNIETLRYMQGTLVDTNVFINQMRAHNAKQPTWLYEMTCRIPKPSKEFVIDISEEEIEEIIVEEKVEEEKMVKMVDCITENFLCSPFVEKLTLDELTWKRVNRYFITNIPYFGYMEAYQRDNKAIDVYWPTGNRGYRFPNVTFAKTSLIQLLSQTLYPVPVGFKINVVIMTNLDLINNKPVEKKYFNLPGPYICGEFGVYGKEDIPEELLIKYNVNSIDAFLAIEERTEDNIERLIHLFGLFLMSNEELRQNANLDDILKWATSEIYVLKKLQQNYETQLKDLQSQLAARKKRIDQVSTVTKKEFTVLIKNIKQLKQNSSPPKTVHNSGSSSSNLQVTETIEIIDSDSDEDNVTVVNPTAFVRKTNNVKNIVNPERSLLKAKYSPNNQRSLLKEKQPVLISRNKTIIIESKPIS